ncbi:hypothetical protein PCASD_04455 [Puccinia coronata f. sp. avenae]|nr:hypothetical protein PCASD_04455 [Puccinia coronata f. sp. avenae]
MDTTPSDATGQQPIPSKPAATTQTDSPLIQYLKMLMADPARQGQGGMVAARILADIPSLVSTSNLAGGGDDQIPLLQR